jgi:hypothetical protein
MCSLDCGAECDKYAGNRDIREKYVVKTLDKQWVLCYYMHSAYRYLAYMRMTNYEHRR